MKMNFMRKDTWLGKKTVIEIIDFEGQQKELEKIAKSLEQVLK